MNHHLVAHFFQCVEGDADFALSAGRDFVVMDIDFDSGFLQSAHDFVANFGKSVGRRNRNVAAFVARTTTAVVFAGFGVVSRSAVVPVAFRAFHFIVRIMTVDAARDFMSAERNAVEEEEFGFGAEVSGIGDAGAFEVSRRFGDDAARIARINFFGARVENRSENAERWRVVSRIHERGCGIGHQQHIRLVDGLKTAHARAVEHDAVIEKLFVELRFNRIRQMLHITQKSGEFEINKLRSGFFRHRDNRLYICH